MKNKRGLEWGALFAVTLVAAFLRFTNLGTESLWDGEIFTLLFTQYEWDKFLPSVSAFSAHPPLWFLITKGITTFGWNETLLRAPAAFAGIAAIPALYALGKRLFDARVALFSATLLALSPMHVLYSQNARNYAFFVLLVIFLIYGAYRALHSSPPRPLSSKSKSDFEERGAGGEARWWIVFACAALTGLYTHYLFILPLAGTILAIALKLIYATRNNEFIRSPTSTNKFVTTLLRSSRAFLIALIAITALYLPWTPTVGSAFLGRQLTREQGHEEDENTALALEDAPRLLKDFSGDATWGLVLFSALAVVGIVWAWRAGKRAPLFWFGISLVLPLFFMLLLAPRRLPAKYLIYVLPAYLLFVACGVVSITEFLRARFLKTDARAFAFALAILAVLAFATLPNMPYWNGAQTIFTGEGWLVVDEWKAWRAVASSVTSRAHAGDMILFPDEARALTARSVIPYFDDAFLQNVYNAPPQGRVWWVSEAGDLNIARGALVASHKTFDQVVVQEWQPVAAFREIELTNTSFEDGFKGWEKPAGIAEWSREENIVADGTASARVTMRRAEFAALRSTAFDVTPGKLYRVAAYVKNPTLGFYTASPQLFVNFYGASNAPPKRTKLVTLAPSDKPGWSLMVTDGIVPTDATTARVEFLFREYARNLNATSWIDGVRVWIEE